MEDNDIKNALLKFNYIVSGETEKECPITIISRRDIVGEDAELVRFSFGYLEEPCVAIFYTDGTFFTPYDWQNPTWLEKDWTIENERWVDSRCMEAIVFNGMPRVLF